MSKRAIEAMGRFGEVNFFMRGIVPLIGFKTDTVEYSRKKRELGETKYPLKKMISFATDGIISFSVKPIHYVLYTGIAVLLAAIFIFIYIFIGNLRGHTIPGWTSLTASVWFIGSLQFFRWQLLCIPQSL